MGAGGQDQAVGGDRLTASTGPVNIAVHHIDAHPVVAVFDRPDVGANVERQRGVGVDGRPELLIALPLVVQSLLVTGGSGSGQVPPELPTGFVGSLQHPDSRARAAR